MGKKFRSGKKAFLLDDIFFFCFVMQVEEEREILSWTETLLRKRSRRAAILNNLIERSNERYQPWKKVKNDKENGEINFVRDMICVCMKRFGLRGVRYLNWMFDTFRSPRKLLQWDSRSFTVIMQHLVTKKQIQYMIDQRILFEACRTGRHMRSILNYEKPYAPPDANVIFSLLHVLCIPEKVSVEEEEDDSDSQLPTCTVCLENVSPKAFNSVTLDCGHHFHASCIYRNVCTVIGNATFLNASPHCPTCRAPARESFPAFVSIYVPNAFRLASLAPLVHNYSNLFLAEK